jgi:hypothetical protein
MKGSIEKSLIKLELERMLKTSYGLIYIGISVGLSIFIIMINLLLGPTPQTAAAAKPGEALLGLSNPASYVLVAIYPYILPLFTIMGAAGVAYFFSGDKSWGFFEYLMGSLKVKVGMIYFSYILTTLAIMAILVTVNVSVAILAIYFYIGSIPSFFNDILLVYSIPITFISALISVLAMLTWSSLSKSYPGINSPGGIGTILGIVPILGFLFISFEIGVSHLLVVSALYVTGIALIFIFFFMIAVRKMANERMIA